MTVINNETRKAFRAGAQKAEVEAKNLAQVRAADALERIANTLEEILILMRHG